MMTTTSTASSSAASAIWRCFYFSKNSRYIQACPACACADPRGLFALVRILKAMLSCPTPPAGPAPLGMPRVRARSHTADCGSGRTGAVAMKWRCDTRFPTPSTLEVRGSERRKRGRVHGAPLAVGLVVRAAASGPVRAAGEPLHGCRSRLVQAQPKNAAPKALRTTASGASNSCCHDRARQTCSGQQKRGHIVPHHGGGRSPKAP